MLKQFSTTPIKLLEVKSEFYDLLRTSLYLSTRINDNTKRNNYIKSLNNIYHLYQSEGGAKQIDQMYYYQSQCYKILMKMENNHFNFEGQRNFTQNQSIQNLIKNIEARFLWVHFPSIENDEIKLANKQKYSVDFLDSIIGDAKSSHSTSSQQKSTRNQS
ncbi:hypothetical protein ABPG72_007240 [Tetrahymena utriculariae]